MTEKTYNISGLDCAEEVAILRREVGGLSGVIDLEFDVVNARMSVVYDADAIEPEKIVIAVDATGMKASPWERRVENKQVPFWERYGRPVMAVLSGGLLAGGFVTHWVLHGSLMDAFAGDHAGEHAFPLSVILLYVASVVAGAWYVVPKAIRAARRFRPDMNFLMVVAVTGAMVIGEWFEAAMVSFLFAIAVLPLLAFAASWAEWVYRGLVILVIACPCALVISTPVGIVSALTASARNGVLIKGGVYIEAAGRLKALALALDKTGTLTPGRPEVHRILPLNGHTEQEILERAAAQAVGGPLSREYRLDRLERSNLLIGPIKGVLVSQNVCRENVQQLNLSSCRCCPAGEDRLAVESHFVHDEAISLAFQPKIADGDDGISYLWKLSSELVTRQYQRHRVFGTSGRAAGRNFGLVN